MSMPFYVAPEQRGVGVADAVLSVTLRTGEVGRAG